MDANGVVKHLSVEPTLRCRPVGVGDCVCVYERSGGGAHAGEHPILKLGL